MGGIGVEVYHRLPLHTLRLAEDRRRLAESLLDAAGKVFSPVAPMTPRQESERLSISGGWYGVSRGFITPADALEAVRDDPTSLEITDVGRLALPDIAAPLKALPMLLPGDTLAGFAVLGGITRRAPPLRPPRGCHLVAEEVEAELYIRLYRLRLLRFDTVHFPIKDGRGKPVYNGLFKLGKGDGEDRMLMDLRPGNSCSDDPPDPNLPGSADLPTALLYLESRGVRTTTWGLWSEDTRGMYNTIAAGAAVEPLQCLRPMSDSTYRRLMAMGVPEGELQGRRVPVLCCLAMGNKWSVFVAQRITLNYVQRTLAELPVVLHTQIVILPYIDDVNVAGDCLPPFDHRPAACFMRVYRRLMLDDGWELKASKRLEGAPVASAIGIEVNFPSGIAALPIAKLGALLSALSPLRNVDVRITPRVLRELVGAVVWGLLPHRPFFSLLSFLFKWLAKHTVGPLLDTSLGLPRSVRREIATLVALLPMAIFHFRASLGGTIVSDACTSGGAAGISFNHPTDMPTLDYLRRTVVRQGQRPKPKFGCPVDLSFGFVGWEFSSPSTRLFPRLPGLTGSIAHKEAFACLVGLVMATRSGLPQTHASPTVWATLNDNMNVVCMVQKGRCKSLTLNRVMRRIAALSTVWGIKLAMDYIFTEENPADAPSRDASLRRFHRTWGSERPVPDLSV